MTAAVVLAAVAGYVDAFVFLRVAQVFIANQSGNLIVGGMAIGGSDVGDLVLPAVSVVAYIGGAAVAAALFDRPSRQGRLRLFDTVSGVVAVLLGSWVALALAGEGRDVGPRTGLVVAIVATTALSMGALATAVRRAGGVAVLTTASTGAITSIGVELGRRRGRLDPAARTRIARLATVVGGYVGGAAGAALLADHTSFGPELLVVPCIAMGLMLAAQLGPPSR
jgi:uncharacterized membrane protein YoaK (UPF0700 family)